MGGKKFIPLLIVVLSLLSFLGAVELPPKISLRVPPEAAVEGQALPLYITVIHDSKQQIDPKQAMLDGTSLTLEPIQQEKIAPEKLFEKDDQGVVVVSRFRALLPPRKAGVYNVGPVTMVIGGITFSSGSVTVNVQGAVSTRQFRLESKVELPVKMFPGQEVVFEYRIFFKLPMRLTREDLPLLQCPGFFNIGSPEIVEDVVDEENVQTIRQRARAVAPGKIEVPVSVIEGMVVEKDGTLLPPLLRAQASGMTMNIYAFPDKGRPSTFYGALGSFVWRVSTPDGTKAEMGKPIKVEYRVSGRGDLSTVKFPYFDQMPRLTDNFVTESTPPVGEESEGTKTFILILRPKSAGQIEVPGFFFTSFDPVSEKYLTTSVSPVSFSVAGVKEDEVIEQNEQTFGQQLAPAFELNEATARETMLSVWWVVSVFIFAIGIAIAEVAVSKKVRAKKNIETSQDLFYKAVMNRSKKEEGLRLLKRAFYLKLFELKLTKNLEETPAGLKGEGVISEVRNLLQEIDEELYHSESVTKLQEIYDEAAIVYHQLKQLLPK